MNKILDFIESLIEHHKKAIILLMLLVAVTGGIAGYRYYVYTQEDTQFCATCHLMQESFKSWEAGKHWQIKCQTCHQMSVFEQNRLLVAFVVQGKTGPQEQEHGRVKPWSTCKGCHMGDVEQGSVSMRKSYGHARHVFMENIGCENCHSGTHHDFKPQENACSKCHPEKLIHGLGMEGLSCLNCHTYGEEGTRMVSTARCLRCHDDIPRDTPMARFECFECHKPHGQISFKSKDCLGECHGNEAKVGQHGLHLSKTELECLDCHKAHTWVIGKKEAKGLCDRCHHIKDPQTFIY